MEVVAAVGLEGNLPAVRLNAIQIVFGELGSTIVLHPHLVNVICD